MNKRTFASIIAISILIFLSLIFFGYRYYSQRNVDAYNSLIRKGNEAVAVGKYQEALSLLNQSLEKTAGNRNMEMFSDFKIGMITLSIDANKGVEILKSLSLDKSYNNRYRAYSINQLVTHFIDKSKDDKLGNLLFSGEKWGEFLEGNNFALALRRASEWSASLFPTFVAEYRIAAWYSDEVKSDKLSADEKNIYLGKIKEHLKKGDDVITAIYSSGRTTYNELGFGYAQKAKSMEVLYDNDLVGRNDVIATYQDSLTNLETENDYPSKIIIPYVRFYLAAFTARTASGNQAVENLVRDIIRPIYSDKFYADSKYINGLIKRALDPENKDNQLKENFITLARLDSAFRTYLIQKGWGEKDL